jgi:hypothetical protein
MMGAMDNMQGDTRSMRERFEELRKREQDGVIEEDERQELQNIRMQLFGKGDM